ncbi:MAG: transporter, fusion protein, partial [Deltaproteobacteria bacterium]|nr:transporter, fusion protein [Deltaproteobacteria bacterium]
MTDKESPKVIRASDFKPEVTDEEIAAILKKVDKESTFRKLSGFSYRLVFWIAVGWSCFQLYTAMFGMLAAQLQRSIHLSFAFVILFLLYPFRTSSTANKLKWNDFLFA